MENKELNILDALTFLSENEGVTRKGFYRWFMELPDSKDGERQGMIIINFLIQTKMVDQDLKLTKDGKEMLENPNRYAYLFETKSTGGGNSN